MRNLSRRQFVYTGLAPLLLSGNQASPATPPIDPQGRITLSLDGLWEIADSVSGDAVPESFGHRCPVPGLADLSQPEFPDVGKFDSREILQVRTGHFELPLGPTSGPVGNSLQERNYFWYRTTFKAPGKKMVARLKIGKAQFGTVVWLNGKKIGEHYSCFTAGYFDLTEAMNWKGDNQLLVRIGAHPGAVPPTVPTGIDFEKLRWIPGIYDSVTVMLSDNPVIESIQIAPRLTTSEIEVQTELKNYGGPCSCALTHAVKTWKGQARAGQALPKQLTLKAGETKLVRQTIKIPNAKPWSPETPFLYVLESNTGSDSVSTRFGMREFRFDTVTKRAYLNGQIYFLRGSNITLHRFFEDTKRGALPWNKDWVRKLLLEIPKQFHWNAFRFCIGPVPDFWFDFADEAGLLIQNEYFIWTYHQEYDTNEMIQEYKEWMHDCWNHPSVAIWDACNETRAEVIPNVIIPAVRNLDLSDRPWENGYNLPSGPNDPVEDHPYLFSRIWSGGKFDMVELEQMTGAKSTNSPHPTGHAVILNEYGWLWLNRDGSTTFISKPVWDRIAPNSSGEERLKLNAYLLAGLTEFWRAHRNFAAVLHFVYLSGFFPGNMTCDHFRNIETLELHEDFRDYLTEAFKPLGVYINFWHPTLKVDAKRPFDVMIVNDEPRPVSGKLVMALESPDGKEVATAQTLFAIPRLGQMTYKLYLQIPKVEGPHLLKALAYPEGQEVESRTLSRRKVTIVEI